MGKNTNESLDLRAGEGQQHEDWARLLSTDLAFMRQALYRAEAGAEPTQEYYDVLATHFSREDFFPAGDEELGFPNFPNLARFFSCLYLLNLRNQTPLSTRITQWKKLFRQERLITLASSMTLS